MTKIIKTDGRVARHRGKDEAVVIAIDGASCTGKATISDLVAKDLGANGWHRLDCGRVYRAIAYDLVYPHGAAGDHILPAYRLGDAATALEAARRFVCRNPAIDEVQYPSEECLRSERVLEVAADIAVFWGVRETTRPFFRAHARPPGLVADGREVGTFQFPDASVKFFLKASPEVREKRAGARVRGGKMLSNETYLTQHPDAHVIDTTDLTPQEAATRILATIPAWTGWAYPDCPI